METIQFWSGDEWLDVEVISQNAGILRETSFNSELGYSDVVLINYEEKEILQVLQKKSKAIFLSYEYSMVGIEGEWGFIAEFFENKNFPIKKCGDGVFIWSVPINCLQDEIELVLEECPIPCYEITSEDLINSDDDNQDDDEDDDDSIFYLN